MQASLVVHIAAKVTQASCQHGSSMCLEYFSRRLVHRQLSAQSIGNCRSPVTCEASLN
jgi:hypothetical protein